MGHYFEDKYSGFPLERLCRAIWAVSKIRIPGLRVKGFEAFGGFKEISNTSFRVPIRRTRKRTIVVWLSILG